MPQALTQARFLHLPRVAWPGQIVGESQQELGEKEDLLSSEQGAESQHSPPPPPRGDIREGRCKHAPVSPNLESMVSGIYGHWSA